MATEGALGVPERGREPAPILEEKGDLNGTYTEGYGKDVPEDLPEDPLPDPDVGLSDEERAELDRKLVRKLDFKLIPWVQQSPCGARTITELIGTSCRFST
jgi:hypothetical protein